ncbi:MAG: hypothetical protein FWB96_08685 [Defluviitaleaceae bacterium]|nr:hypothetical protein [Defluviitaleaceae bacterium]MCL2263699.1 hypothetical protein [Defluviitaleaceae bacterium]
MKKFASFVICFVMLQSVPVRGFSVEEIIGYVVEINDDIVHIVGEPFAEEGFSDTLIRVGNAPVYDLRTGFRAGKYDIVQDMDIRTAFSYSGTEPFPAVVVWLNWNDDNAAVFTVVASENINTSEDSTVFLSADGKYRVALTPETMILCPYNGYLSPWDITSGTELFVWVDMITASTPALVYPDKVVVVH